MTNKRCTVDQQITGQRAYQQTTEVVPSYVFESSAVNVVEGPVTTWAG